MHFRAQASACYVKALLLANHILPTWCEFGHTAEPCIKNTSALGAPHAHQHQQLHCNSWGTCVSLTPKERGLEGKLKHLPSDDGRPSSSSKDAAFLLVGSHGSACAKQSSATSAWVNSCSQQCNRKLSAAAVVLWPDLSHLNFNRQFLQQKQVWIENNHNVLNAVREGKAWRKQKQKETNTRFFVCYVLEVVEVSQAKKSVLNTPPSPLHTKVKDN